jgi:hypothetical protein
MNLAGIVDGHPDGATALRWTGGSCTFGELRSRVASLRGALMRSGSAPGGRCCASDWVRPLRRAREGLRGRSLVGLELPL